MRQLTITFPLSLIHLHQLFHASSSNAPASRKTCGTGKPIINLSAHSPILGGSPYSCSESPRRLLARSSLNTVELSIDRSVTTVPDVFRVHAALDALLEAACSTLVAVLCIGLVTVIGKSISVPYRQWSRNDLRLSSSTFVARRPCACREFINYRIPRPTIDHCYNSIRETRPLVLIAAA